MVFERFSDQGRRAVEASQEQARRLGHRQIAPEHLLLGLLEPDGGHAIRTLELLAISPARAREAALAAAGTGPGTPAGHVPFSPQAKGVLANALREALKLRHQYIGSEHLLLAIMHDRDTISGRALAGLGADPDAARGYVAALVEDTGTPPEVLAALAARPQDPARRGLLRRRRAG
jgi:ATP-dependent Clp protease ATP-binding subunit ClpC